MRLANEKRRRLTIFPSCKQLTARSPRTFARHSATGSRSGAAGDLDLNLDPQGLRPHLPRSHSPEGPVRIYLPIIYLLSSDSRKPIRIPLSLRDIPL